MKIEFNASKRVAQGTGASRRLRRTDRVPGILYGGPDPAQPISVDHNEIFHKLKLEAFHSSVLTMQLEGSAQQVLLRDVQVHAYKPRVMHVDFQRVDATHKIHMKVPLHFINAELAPGVKLQGGIASHTMNDLDVECLPADLPEFIEVDLKDLQAGKSLHVSELAMPKGVTPVMHRGEDPVVASIVVPRGATEEAEAAEPAVAPSAVPATKQSADKEEKKEDKKK
jgi:large subunit ribosomal protein L25